MSQKVLVAGTGISGIAAAKLLLAQGGEVVLYDGNEKLSAGLFKISDLDDNGKHLHQIDKAHNGDEDRHLHHIGAGGHKASQGQRSRISHKYPGRIYIK